MGYSHHLNFISCQDLSTPIALSALESMKRLVRQTNGIRTTTWRTALPFGIGKSMPGSTSGAARSETTRQPRKESVYFDFHWIRSFEGLLSILDLKSPRMPSVSFSYVTHENDSDAHLLSTDLSAKPCLHWQGLCILSNVVLLLCSEAFRG